MTVPGPPQMRRRRLQREPDFTGARLTRFREVFLRHGLPGLVLACLFLAVPGMLDLLLESLSRAANYPILYGLGAVGILVGLSAYVRTIDKEWSPAQLWWIIYLGVLSIWEEWVFRLALPQVLEGVGASTLFAIFTSAVLFGAMHYFTLRWKWYWCVSAFLGALYFSFSMERHGDLLLVAAIHWVATSINTPRPPRQSSDKDFV